MHPYPSALGVTKKYLCYRIFGDGNPLEFHCQAVAAEKKLKVGIDQADLSGPIVMRDFGLFSRPVSAIGA